MDNKRLCFFVLSSILLVTPLTVHALEPVTGTYTRKEFTAAGCEITSMTVKYRFHLSKGYPLVSGAYKWTAAQETPHDCLPADTSILIEVSAADKTGYIKLAHIVSSAETGYGYSREDVPDWGKVMYVSAANTASHLPSVSAKKMWRAGLSVNGFEVTGTARPEAEKQLKPKEIYEQFPTSALPVNTPDKAPNLGSSDVPDGDIFTEDSASDSSSIFSENVEHQTSSIFSEDIGPKSPSIFSEAKQTATPAAAQAKTDLFSENDQPGEKPSSLFEDNGSTTKGKGFLDIVDSNSGKKKKERLQE